MKWEIQTTAYHGGTWLLMRVQTFIHYVVLALITGLIIGRLIA